MDSDAIDQQIAEICRASNALEAYELFCAYEQHLGDCKIILASEHGGSTPGLAIDHTFPEGAAVRGLFRTPRVLVLDRQTVADMRSHGRANYLIDFSIALDTQALSHLQPHLQGRRTDRDMHAVFNFIARPDVSIDPLPYQLENLENLHDPRSADFIFNKLRAYEILRTIDYGHLELHGEVRSRRDEPELQQRTQQMIAGMYSQVEDNAFMRVVRRGRDVVYLYLLKMVHLQFSAPRRPVWDKLRALLEFSDSVLGTIAQRETLMAKAYFERGQALPFFGRVQAGNPNLFDELRRMTWDCLHLRHMEQRMTFAPADGARYMFPALLTFDRRLRDLIDLYPLRACAFRLSENRPLTFYADDWSELVAPEYEQRAWLDALFDPPRREARKHRQKHLGELAPLVAMLEEELHPFAQSRPRTVGATETAD